MVSEDEQRLIQQVFSQGPGILFDKGMTEPEVTTFLARQDVKDFWQLLTREFSNQEVLAATTKFIARRQLARLQPGAVGVLGAALAGPEYKKAPNGELLRNKEGGFIIENPGISSSQLSAASEVLDRLGVMHNTIIVKSADTGVTLTLAENKDTKKIIQTDSTFNTEEERSRSRERVRVVIEQLAGKLGVISAKVKKEITGPRRKKTRNRPLATKAEK